MPTPDLNQLFVLRDGSVDLETGVVDTTTSPELRQVPPFATVPEHHTAALRAGTGSFTLPSIMVSMLWHPRTQADPVHAWLRECVRKTTTDLGRLS